MKISREFYKYHKPISVSSYLLIQRKKSRKILNDQFSM